MNADVRNRSEELEYELLSPFAAKSRDARRAAPIEECPFRTRFQRDRDRIIHSKAFRRLKHKTQVYIVSGDHYRTRMTHSLEVAQISRTIARGLRLNEDLVEAIALGHDVGHTPFGHSGEGKLNEITGHFAHNEQSLRVVKHLEKEGQGLNLTEEVEDGICHHSGSIRPKTLEGRIVHIADRIAYLCHDFDDSRRAGILEAEMLPDIVIERLGKDPSHMITGMVSDVILTTSERLKLAEKDSNIEPDIVMTGEMKNVMDTFRSFMFQNVYKSDLLSQERHQAVFVVECLYKYFMENPEKLPVEFYNRQSSWGLKQTVVDYVAGLTDGYAIHLFNTIFVPPVGAML